MVLKQHVEGYQNFLKFIENLTPKPKVPTFILYTGSNLPDGNSWCPDCVEAKPFIEKGLEALPKPSNFVVVQVGDRPSWKDPNNPFRTDQKISLKVLPTLMKWGTQKRLEGDQLLDVDLIRMLFIDTDDE